MMRPIAAFFLGVGGALILVPAAYSQGCCSVGTSALGGSERGSPAKNSLLASATYHFNSLDQGYNGTRRIDDPLQRMATVEMLGVDVEYGFAERVSLLLQIGYFRKARSITVRGSSFEPPERVEFSGEGIGDLLMLTKYQILAPGITDPFEVAVGAGAKLPIGRYQQEVNGTRLSLDLQAGTGAADLLAWLYGSYSNLPAGFKLFGWLLHRYPGGNFDSYRYGDETLVNLGVSKSVAGFLDVGLAARGRIAQRDFSNGRLLQSTGGVQFFLFPSVSYLSPESSFRIFGQIPVHQNMYGIQLGLSYVIGVELTYRFELSSS